MDSAPTEDAAAEELRETIVEMIAERDILLKAKRVPYRRWFRLVWLKRHLGVRALFLRGHAYRVTLTDMRNGRELDLKLWRIGWRLAPVCPPYLPSELLEAAACAAAEYEDTHGVEQWFVSYGLPASVRWEEAEEYYAQLREYAFGLLEFMGAKDYRRLVDAVR